MENATGPGKGLPSWAGFWDFPGVASSSCCAYTGDHHHHPYHPLQQQHLTCLKLGKRQYYEEEGVVGASAAVVMAKKERASTAATVVARCQVEECNELLGDAKEYHRRHKVCEVHSKAPKVLVHGIEQRFCQQCSRFHVLSEFDDTKRSCRRRLAGHNERRRKSTGNDSINIKNTSLEGTMMGGRFPCISSSTPQPQGRALSLLSCNSSPCIPTFDLSSRSSAALSELIAENRAAILAKQVLSEHNGNWHSMNPENHLMLMQHHQQLPSQAPLQFPADGWNHYSESGTQVTLDLMQMPGFIIRHYP